MKTRSSHEVWSLGLGGVPNEPMQKLRAGPNLYTACQVLNSHPDIRAILQNLYVQALLAKYQIIQVCIACQVVNMDGNALLAGSETRASSYVDGKNRQRVFAVLTVECRVGIFVSVRKKGPWGNRDRPDSLSALSLKSEFSIYIEYLSDRTGTVGCIWGGYRQFDRRVT